MLINRELFQPPSCFVRQVVLRAELRRHLRVRQHLRLTALTGDIWSSDSLFKWRFEGAEASPEYRGLPVVRPFEADMLVLR